MHLIHGGHRSYSHGILFNAYPLELFDVFKTEDILRGLSRLLL